MADIQALYIKHAEAVFLARYLAKLVEWDAKACVRLRRKGRVVGVYGAPPTGCISFVALPIQEEHAFDDSTPDPDLDRVVSAGRLRDVLGDVSHAPVGDSNRRLQIPEAVTGPTELAMLPPQQGWEVEGQIGAGVLDGGVAKALDDYRSQIDPESTAPDAAARAQRVADEIWARPIVGTLPTRGAHTAKLLGFLSNPDVNITILNNRGWTRLNSPSGQVFCPEEFGSLALRLIQN